MKKLLAIVVSITMIMVMFVSCGGGGGSSDSGDKIKVGLICVHDENSTYDKNFIDGFNEACDEMGIEGVIKTNIPEGQECYDAAGELVDDGCALVISDSYGHQPFMLQAATDNPDVKFVSCTGDNAASSGLDNYSNAFASIYEGRYLAGVAAGMKLKEMIDNGDFTAAEAKIGYVGAKPYAEVISGYTSFYLGVKSIVPEVTMDVTYTGEWYDETAEKEAANKLIQGGCKLISQHADSMGAPTACENAGVPDVSYNGSTVDACPNTFIVASKINWTPYFKYAAEKVQNGEAIDVNWTGGFDTGSVELTDINEKAAAAGTQEKLDEVEAGLKDGSIQVFDTSTFTVDGKELTQAYALDTDGDFVPDSEEAVYDGAFHESVFQSAPYFGMIIDGITLLDSGN